MTSASLNDDGAYVRMMGRRSEFPFRYLTSFTALGTCTIDNCNKQFHSGPAQVGALNSLVDSVPTRIWAHGDKPSTELFGTAPFRARGDGQRLAPDVSNQLMRQPAYWQECARPLSEMAWDRYDYIAFPNRAEWWSRGGESSRLGPIYVQPVPM